MAFGDPVVPHFVHEREVVVDVAQVDGCRQQMLFVTARFDEQIVDASQCRTGLFLDVSIGVGSDLPRQIDRAVVDHDVTCSGGRVDAGNGHLGTCCSLPRSDCGSRATAPATAGATSGIIVRATAQGAVGLRGARSRIGLSGGGLGPASPARRSSSWCGRKIFRDPRSSRRGVGQQPGPATRLQVWPSSTSMSTKVELGAGFFETPRPWAA
ncbi:hypothetical protein GQR58_029199 [Nymphon striatum]|nr:hypothetical protein GQR58_029199 [Nymphon striatum]